MVVATGNHTNEAQPDGDKTALVVAMKLVTKGTVIGGVIGGATGAAVSVIMKDMDIVLPAGSHLMLTLKQRLTVMAK